MWQVQVITYVVQTGAEEKRAEVVEGGAGVELSHSGRRGSGRSSPYSFPPLTTSIHTETQQGRGFPPLVTSICMTEHGVKYVLKIPWENGLNQGKRVIGTLRAL